jgi:predicted permease
VGFETSNLATFSLDPSSSGYSEERTAQIVFSAIDTLSRIPGAITVAATNDPELQGNSEGSSFSLQDYKTSEDEVLSFEDARVTPNYFATLRHPLLVGREITSSDTAGQQPVAVVNLALAKKYYGSAQNAIGRLISEGRGKDTKFDTTIVGVVGDSRHTDLRTPLKPAVYRPYAQQKHPGGVEVYVRTTQAPEAIEPAIRLAIHQMDPTLVVDELRTMQEQVDRAASDERALALLAISFSALALLLAAVGLYGVLAYSTAQRTREIGVRLALGSRRMDVVALVVREMVLIAAIATAIALPSVVAVSHYFSSQLYGVTNFDPLSLGAAALLTALMVAMAAALPARRAAAIEPMQALRTE